MYIEFMQTIDDADELEANLVMELAKARRDIFIVEKSLTDCMVHKCELMTSLLKFKSNIFTQKLNKADVRLGFMQVTFKEFSLSHHAPAHNAGKSFNSDFR
jgi:hypothetical protein